MSPARLLVAAVTAGAGVALAPAASATPCPGQVAVVFPGGLGYTCVPVQQWRYCAERFAADPVPATAVGPAGDVQVWYADGGGPLRLVDCATNLPFDLEDVIRIG